jgi:exoribonuclease R
VYLPDRVIPMLPEILSNSLASLQAGRTRYTVSALIDYTPDGIPTSKTFARSAINVDHRFTYEQAIEVMKAPDASHPGVAPEIATMMGLMLELAMTLRRRRFARGALELSLPEIEIDLGEEGQVAGAHLSVNDESHQVIEDFMLAANEAVASSLTEKQIGFLRRAHPDPEAFKLLQFAEFVRSLGLALDQPQSRLQVHRQLIALLEGKKPRAKHDELVVLAQHCTRTERRAEAAERELIRVKLLSYLEHHVGKAFHAVIVGVEDFGLFCRLAELPVDGLIHVTSLADDYYYLEGGTHTLVGRRSGRRHRLGDREIVRIAHVDVDRRELDLVLADAPLATGKRGRSARASSSRPDRPPHGARRPFSSDSTTADGMGSSPHRPKGPKKKKGRAKAKKSGKKKRH